MEGVLGVHTFGGPWMKEKLWKAITSDAAEKRKQDDLEKAELSGLSMWVLHGLSKNEVRHFKCPIEAYLDFFPK